MKKNLNIFEIIYIIVGIPWLFLMVMSSGLYTSLKTMMLIILFITCLAEILVVKKGHFTRSHIVYVFVFVSYYMVSLFVGIFSNYDFSFKHEFSLIQYYCITPIFTVVIAEAMLLYKRRSEFIWNYLKYLALALSVFDLFFVLLYRLGNLPHFFSFIKISSDVVSKNGIAIRVSNEMSFMFLMPVYMFVFFCQNNKSNRDRIIYTLIITFGIIYILLSGRKITELVLILELAFILIWKIINNKIYIKKIIGNAIKIVFIFVIFAFMINNISNILNFDGILKKAYATLSNGIQSSSGGVQKRTGNAEALFELWLNSPLIGNGLNSYARESLASATSLWSYEIVYNALLAQTGVIGIIIFFLGAYYILKKLIEQYNKTKNEKYIAVFLGFLSFIICGATNPLVYIIWPWIVSLVIGCEENDVKGE